MKKQKSHDYAGYIDLLGTSFLARNDPEGYTNTLKAFNETIKAIADSCGKMRGQLNFYVFSDSCFISSSNLDVIIKTMQIIRKQLFYLWEIPFRASICKGKLHEQTERGENYYFLSFGPETCAVKLVSLESSFKGIGINIDCELATESKFIVKSIYFDENNNLKPYYDLSARGPSKFALKKISTDFQIEFIQTIMKKALQTSLYDKRLATRYISSLITIIQSSRSKRHQNALQKFTNAIVNEFFNSNNFKKYWNLNGIEFIYAIIVSNLIGDDDRIAQIKRSLSRGQFHLLLKAFQSVPLEYIAYKDRVKLFSDEVTTSNPHVKNKIGVPK